MLCSLLVESYSLDRGAMHWPGVLGIEEAYTGEECSGCELTARSLFAGGTETRNGELGRSSAGADDDRRKWRAVTGASKRVTTSGTWLRSNSLTASSSSAPFFPLTSNSAIFSQRFVSFGPTSRTFRFFVGYGVCSFDSGLKEYPGYLALCSSSIALAFSNQICFSAGGSMPQV